MDDTQDIGAIQSSFLNILPGYSDFVNQTSNRLVNINNTINNYRGVKVMIIDIEKLPALHDVNITVMSEPWVLDQFFILFYLAVLITIPILMFTAHNKTPIEENENTAVAYVSKRICCFKNYVPTLFFALRGLHNLEDFYKDIFFAIHQPHSNASLTAMLYISIFLPLVMIVYTLYKIGIAKEFSACKRFFYVASIYFGRYFV